MNTINLSQPCEERIEVGEAPPIVQKDVVLQREADPVLVAVHPLPWQPDGHGQLDGGRRGRLGLARCGRGIGRAGEQDGNRGGGLGDGVGRLGWGGGRGGGEDIVVVVGGSIGSWLAAGAAAALLGTGARHEAVHGRSKCRKNGGRYEIEIAEPPTARRPARKQAGLALPPNSSFEINNNEVLE